MFEKALEAARARRGNQYKQMVEAKTVYEHAVKGNLQATAKTAGARFKRFEMAVAITDAEIRELEQAIGVLPLDKKKEK